MPSLSPRTDALKDILQDTFIQSCDVGDVSASWSITVEKVGRVGRLTTMGPSPSEIFVTMGSASYRTANSVPLFIKLYIIEFRP